MVDRRRSIEIARSSDLGHAPAAADVVSAKTTSPRLSWSGTLRRKC
jgi:hypothetical protein